MTVTPVQRGETVTHQGRPYWVLSSCDQCAVGYYCDTHGEAFPHRQALLDHVKGDGEHRVAIHCPKHGFEAPPPKATA